MRNTKGRLDDGNQLVVYIKGSHRNITRVNADQVQKEVSEILQRHVHMEKVGESLRIFCKNEKEKARMMAQKDISDSKVKVTEPYTRLLTKYTPRGIIFDVDLDMEDEEISAATSVVTAKRIEKTISGQRKRTGQVIVTFEGEELPEFKYMGWRRFRIQKYIPEPIRCYKCQHYGHKAITCKQQEKCPICAGKHNTKNCDKVSKEPEARFSTIRHQNAQIADNIRPHTADARNSRQLRKSPKSRPLHQPESHMPKQPKDRRLLSRKMRRRTRSQQWKKKQRKRVIQKHQNTAAI